eukprot:m.525687 g.525687  ORF g.525687 m.525687 type:complete len:202 (-) comp57545_c0_seq3:2782-3387(-)
MDQKQQEQEQNKEPEPPPPHLAPLSRQNLQALQRRVDALFPRYVLARVPIRTPDRTPSAPRRHKRAKRTDHPLAQSVCQLELLAGDLERVSPLGTDTERNPWRTRQVPDVGGWASASASSTAEPQLLPRPSFDDESLPNASTEESLEAIDWGWQFSPDPVALHSPDSQSCRCNTFVAEQCVCLTQQLDSEGLEEDQLLFLL